MRSNRWMFLLAALAALASPATAQSPPPADGPLKTVHLVAVMSSQEPALLAAVADFNHGFAEQGCAACAYHVFKMFAGSSGQLNYMLEGDWPSAAQYTKLHTSAAYRDATARIPIMSALPRKEYYGRVVEIKPTTSGRMAELEPSLSRQP